MRASEFANKQTAVNYYSRRAGIIGRVDSGEYVFLLHDHLMYRQQGRDVDEFVIQEVIPKIPRAKTKIKALSDGQHFWLYDNTNQVALGVQILNSEYKIFVVRTVWPAVPTDGVYPIFNVA